MAKNIHEIFKTNPDLLETPEVQEMVKVTDVLLNTDFYVIKGLSSDEAIKLLIDKSF